MIREEAIKDLKIEPCNDAISRQAAIDEIKERFNAARNWYKEIQDNNGDEIMLARAETTLIDFTECSLMLKKLPSVQQEQKVIRCKDCKYAILTSKGEVKYCKKWQVDKDGSYGGDPLYLDGDFFCTSAEVKMKEGK